GVVASMVYWDHPLRRQSPDIDWPPHGVFPALLHEAAPGVPQDTVLPLTKGLVAVLRVRPEMADFDITAAHGRVRLLHWRLTIGCHEHRFLQFTPEEIAYLKA